MIKLSINGQVIGIPGEALADAVIAHAPPWLVGSAAPPSGTAGAIRSGVKAVLPMLLGFVHKQSVEQGRALPPPQLKSDAARANMVAYGIHYLLDNFAAVAAQETFQAQGEVDGDGIFYVTGIVSAGPVVGEETAAGLDAVPSLPGGVG